MQDFISGRLFSGTIGCLVAAALLSSPVHAADILAPPGEAPVDELEVQAETRPADALLENARSYAADHGVEIDEAVRRLRLQGSLEDVLARLESAMGDRFAGAWIEHEPEFRAVVRLAGRNEEVPSDARSIAEESAVPVEFVTGAETGLAELVDALESALPRLQAMHSRLAGAEVDVQSGEIVLFVEEGTVEEATLQRDAREIFGVPVRIESVDAPVGDGHTRGGVDLSTCTSGFVVRHPSTGTTGYVTAGHCGDNQTYFEFGGPSYSTTFIDEIRDADQDVQWHTTSHIEFPEFHASSTLSYRPLEAQMNRSSQAIGGYVCHRGKTTGYSCGDIVSKTFRPTYTNACPGVTCAAVWVRVEANSLECFPGDSGGPWFLGLTAYGIYKGQSSSGTSAADCN
jgi:streptogrisin C